MTDCKETGGLIEIRQPNERVCQASLYCSAFSLRRRHFFLRRHLPATTAPPPFYGGTSLLWRHLPATPAPPSFYGSISLLHRHLPVFMVAPSLLQRLLPPAAASPFYDGISLLHRHLPPAMVASPCCSTFSLQEGTPNEETEKKKCMHEELLEAASNV